MYRLALTIAVLASQMAFAQVQESKVSQSPLPGSVNEAPEIVELPTIQVWGEQQELALRLVKSALERGRLTGYEARNKLYCWFDTGVGSHMIYLYCAKNKVLNDVNLAYATRGIDGAALVQRNSPYYRSHFPVNPLKFKRKLNPLGPSAVNDEIVMRARQGEALPDNVPTKAEIDRFATAMKKIKALRAESRADTNITTAQLDRRLAAIIDANGLTVDRYNHISDLVERYNSLRKMVQNEL